MLQGRCLCGGIVYQVDGEFSAIDLCHCSYCRRSSGSAFQSNATVQVAEFRFLSGEDLLREYESSPGKFRCFCSACGSPIYARLPKFPTILRLRMGTLDGDPGSRPQGHYDVASKAPWYTIDGDLPQHPD